MWYVSQCEIKWNSASEHTAWRFREHSVTGWRMIDKGKEAVKTLRSHWSIPLINVIRIQLNNILRQLLNTSVPLPLGATSHKTIPSEEKGQAKETLPERYSDTKINCPICIQWFTIQNSDKNGCTQENKPGMTDGDGKGSDQFQTMILLSFSGHL